MYGVLLVVFAFANPVSWDITNLPSAVECEFIYERQDEQGWVELSRGRASLAREWVESTLYQGHGTIGHTLQMYVHATPQQSLIYQPESNIVSHWNAFARIGTAAGGSTVSPYDPVRMMIRAANAGGVIEVEDHNSVVVYRFLPVDQRMSMEIDVELKSLRVLETRTLFPGSVAVRQRVEYDGFLLLQDGTQFPTMQTTTVYPEPGNDQGEQVIRCKLTSVRLVEDKPPAVAVFPESVIHVDSVLKVQLDQSGAVIGPWPSQHSAGNAWWKRNGAGYVFAALGAVMLVLAGVVLRRRSVS